MSSGSKARLTQADYRYLAAAWGLLVFYRLSLALAPFRVVRYALPASRELSAPPWVLARTRWAVAAAAPGAFGATCLPQALAANALLSLQGYASVIRIGVRRGDAGAIQAHAWLVSGDRVVIGDDGERLESFSTITDIGRPG